MNDRRLGSNGRDYKGFCPLGCDAVWSGSYGPRVKTRLPLWSYVLTMEAVESSVISVNALISQKTARDRRKYKNIACETSFRNQIKTFLGFWFLWSAYRLSLKYTRTEIKGYIQIRTAGLMKYYRNFCWRFVKKISRVYLDIPNWDVNE